MCLNSRKYAIKSLNSFYALQCSLNVCYKYEKKQHKRGAGRQQMQAVGHLNKGKSQKQALC